MIRICIGLLLVLSLGSSAQSSDQKENGKPSGNPGTTELSGCLDQRGSYYVLAGTEAMKPKARLKSKSSSDDNFARYIGHLVSVRGQLDSTGEVPVMNVIRIDSLSETCDTKQSR